MTYLVGMYQNIEKNLEVTWPQNFTLQNLSNITKENLKLNMIRLPNFSELGKTFKFLIKRNLLFQMKCNMYTSIISIN